MMKLDKSGILVIYLPLYDDIEIRGTLFDFRVWGMEVGVGLFVFFFFC